MLLIWHWKLEVEILLPIETRLQVVIKLCNYEETGSVGCPEILPPYLTLFSWENKFQMSGS